MSNPKRIKRLRDDDDFRRIPFEILCCVTIHMRAGDLCSFLRVSKNTYVHAREVVFQNFAARTACGVFPDGACLSDHTLLCLKLHEVCADLNLLELGDRTKFLHACCMFRASCEDMQYFSGEMIFFEDSEFMVRDKSERREQYDMDEWLNTCNCNDDDSCPFDETVCKTVCIQNPQEYASYARRQWTMERYQSGSYASKRILCDCWMVPCSGFFETLAFFFKDSIPFFSVS